MLTIEFSVCVKLCLQTFIVCMLYFLTEIIYIGYSCGILMGVRVLRYVEI